MFALLPDAPDIGDLQPLSEAIDALCEILEGDREIVIECLAEIVRRRTEFEHCKQRHDYGGL
jgi:hypothetical protein